MGALGSTVAAVGAASWVVLTSGGCSWIMVTRAPERPVGPTPPVTCTRSVAAPVVDTVVGSLAVIGGAGMAAFGSNPICLNSSCPSDSGLIWGGVALAAAGVVLGVSSGFGYAWTAECREIGALQQSCIVGVEASCTNLEVGPPEKPNRGARCEGPNDCKGGTECKESSDGRGICVDGASTK
jgi:hypothetical protein